MIEQILSIFGAMFYGLVEGISEWLPISSTGHLIILERLMPLTVSEGFMSMFRVVIQLGAVLAVAVVFIKKLWPFVRKRDGKVALSLNKSKLWLKIIIACLPAAIVGILLDDLIDKYLYTYYVVAIMLIIVGLVFVFFDKIPIKEKITSLGMIGYVDALLIGLFQVIAAVLPGTSRSGITIIGGLLLGFSRIVITEFTFFLALPVMFGASLLKLRKFQFVSFYEVGLLLIGCAVAFLVSLVVIKFLLDYVKKHDFKAFGFYRIGLGLLVLLLFFFF